MRLTAENLVRAIKNLPHDRQYNYVHESTKGLIVLHHVQEPEGPIEFKRFDPTKNEKLADKKIESISPQMIWRLANSLLIDRPVNVDRVFGGSYNTRSVLETLVVRTPLFYSCKPGRIEEIGDITSVKKGHKHIIYLPDQPHKNGEIGRIDVSHQISELAIDDAVYSTGIELDAAPSQNKIKIEQDRRHAQIQIALLEIGKQIGFRTWIAANDQSIKYGGKMLKELESTIDDLKQEQVLSAYPDAVKAARLIDCIWFRNGKLMPAVMEVEHSTGVTSGLTRMKGFYDIAPALRDIRWTIVAPDSQRQKVIDKANLEQFLPMDTKFFPYSAVEELYSLCERRKPKGITDDFLDCYMEKCVK